MAVAATCVRAMASGVVAPGEMVTVVNRLLCQRNETMQFVTLFMGLLDIVTGELAWSDCGHLPVYIVGPGGVRASLDSDVGPPLGVFETAAYPTYTCKLAPEEMIVLYTDGVTEAANTAGDFFEHERLLAILNTPGMGTDPRPCVDRIFTEVLAFTGTAPQADDITIVALRLGAHRALTAAGAL
jgi:sigma-B regulation protein RsbU (phosphoserine phosphatase)